MEQNASQKISFSQIAQSIPPNVFAQMDIKVAQAIRQGADVIDLSKGLNKRLIIRRTLGIRHLMVNLNTFRQQQTGTQNYMACI